MTTPDAIERLAILSAQTTARTDRLHEAVCALLAKLEPHVKPNTSVEVDGYTLSRYNIVWKGMKIPSWGFGTRFQEDRSDPWKGPTRTNLIAFAARADKFVAALIAREQKQLAELGFAHSQVTKATSQL